MRLFTRSLVVTLAVAAGVFLFQAGKKSGLSERDGRDFALTNDQLHEWSCNTVFKYAQNHRPDLNGFGCYDICNALSYKIQVSGRRSDEYGHQYGEYQKTHLEPAGLGDEYWDGGEGYDVANACAVTLIGAEW